MTLIEYWHLCQNKMALANPAKIFGKVKNEYCVNALTEQIKQNKAKNKRITKSNFKN